MMRELTKQKGFTLIEVLVATVIMAIGLLGIVTMHGSAMYFTKDSESQWQASSGVFRMFDTMRPAMKEAINGNLNRQADILTAMQPYVVPGPGGVSNNCPDVIASPRDELQCIQRDLEDALPGGRIESITLEPNIVNGINIQVSWLASFRNEDELQECEALERVSTEITDSDASINSSIAASADCGSGQVRRVANWVMLP